jgi:hypothetical protein
MGGTCERFPDIRFVPTGFETGWIAHFFARMDRRQFRHCTHPALTARCC